MMNFRRILLASGSHLLKRASTMVVTPALTGADSSHLLKRACTAVSASVSADLLATSDGALVSAEVSASTMETKKTKMFERLLTLKETGGTVIETFNEIMRREEEEGVSITQSDIASWAMRLYTDEKHRQALELVIFVELLGKIDGYVDPNFLKDVNSREKNSLAYQKLEYMCNRNGHYGFRGNGRWVHPNDPYGPYSFSGELPEAPGYGHWKWSLWFERGNGRRGPDGRICL